MQPGAGISYQLYDYVAPVMATVPDLTGLSRTQAEAAIVAAGLVASASSTITEVAAEADQVLTQNPAAGASVAPGSTVSFTYGSLRIRLPDWVGETRATAVAAVTALGLTPIIATGSQTDMQANQNVVESMTPDADSLVLPASQVILTIWNYIPAANRPVRVHVHRGGAAQLPGRGYLRLQAEEPCSGKRDPRPAGHGDRRRRRCRVRTPPRNARRPERRVLAHGRRVHHNATGNALQRHPGTLAADQPSYADSVDLQLPAANLSGNVGYADNLAGLDNTNAADDATVVLSFFEEDPS